MNEIIQILTQATPFGAIALALVIILIQIRTKKEVKNTQSNHLHGLPEMGETLKRIEEKLDKMNDNLIFIKAKINGKE